MEKLFPAGMKPLGKKDFSFQCHQQLRCFNSCCKKVEMLLYPYDILRLKNNLGITSVDFLTEYVQVVQGDNPFFPALMMRLTEDEQCPFLTATGCKVYADRPSACRMYPLERAIDRDPRPGKDEDYYFLKIHDYCKGHQQDNKQNVAMWIRTQKLHRYNYMNSLWAEVDTLFSKNPWQGEGAGGENQQFAFMVCFNLDQFKRYMYDFKLLQSFRMSREEKRRIEVDEEELLKFGFELLKFLYGGKSRLIKK